jgi:fermentation-respiration switch protein FrsA (DUF1100 family)
LLFYPEPVLAATPSVLFEDVSFDAVDGSLLHGWFLPADSARVLIVSHGNAGNIGDRVSMVQFLLEEFEVNVFAYDYRGYGQSEGSPSEQGTYADIRGAYQWARDRGYAPGDIYLFGQSLGSAVTIDLAADTEVGGVIIEAGLTSIADMMRRLFYLPVGWILRTRYDSLSKVASINAPIAFIHGRDDPVVPFELGEALFETATGPKQLYAVDGAIHEGAIMGLGLERTEELGAFVFR